MVTKKELDRLRQDIADERKKLVMRQEQANLKAEARRLKVKRFFARRPGLAEAGRKITSGAKKAGKAVVKQAQLIKEEQLRQDALDRQTSRRVTKFQKRTTKKAKKIGKVTKKRKMKKNRPIVDRGSPFDTGFPEFGI